MFRSLVASRAFDDVDDKGTGCVPNTSAVLMELVQLTGLNPTQREIDSHWNKGKRYRIHLSDALWKKKGFNASTKKYRAWSTRTVRTETFCFWSFF